MAGGKGKGEREDEKPRHAFRNSENVKVKNIKICPAFIVYK